jgi:hypothetical protein
MESRPLREPREGVGPDGFAGGSGKRRRFPGYWWGPDGFAGGSGKRRCSPGYVSEAKLVKGWGRDGFCRRVGETATFPRLLSGKRRRFPGN